MGLRADEGVFIDEMLYMEGTVGGFYSYAPKFERALCEDMGRNEGDRVMFLAAMCTECVLPITLPVPRPLTVTALVFESWCRWFLIPQMLARGKKYAIMDNAPVHRRNTLRVLFTAFGLQVHFLPKYSPWFAPPEKIFLSTHMKCNMRVEHVRANLIPRVKQVIEGHTAAQCRGAIQMCGYV